MLLCPKCGANLEEDGRFCPECGSALDIAPNGSDGGESTRLVDEGVDFGEGAFRDSFEDGPCGYSSPHGSPAMLSEGQTSVVSGAAMGQPGSFSGSGAKSDALLQTPLPNGGSVRPRDGRTVVIVVLVAVVAVLATLVAVFAVNSCNSSNTVEETRQVETSSVGSDSGHAASESASSSAPAGESTSSSSATAGTPYTYQTHPTSSTAAFWGVWIGASKDQAEAASLANAAQSKGLPAEVTQTTEWENLNAEPWYVVTVGRSSSQDAADTLLAAAKSVGYVDAYVKYSGEHRS